MGLFDGLFGSGMFSSGNHDSPIGAIGGKLQKISDPIAMIPGVGDKWVNLTSNTIPRLVNTGLSKVITPFDKVDEAINPLRRIPIVDRIGDVVRDKPGDAIGLAVGAIYGAPALAGAMGGGAAGGAAGGTAASGGLGVGGTAGAGSAGLSGMSTAGLGAGESGALGSGLFSLPASTGMGGALGTGTYAVPEGAAAAGASSSPWLSALATGGKYANGIMAASKMAGGGQQQAAPTAPAAPMRRTQTVPGGFVPQPLPSMSGQGSMMAMPGANALPTNASYQSLLTNMINNSLGNPAAKAISGQYGQNAVPGYGTALNPGNLPPGMF